MDTLREAWDWEHFKVYHAKMRLAWCFNIIHGQMTMGGWWLWPKVAVEERVGVDDGGQGEPEAVPAEEGVVVDDEGHRCYIKV